MMRENIDFTHLEPDLVTILLQKVIAMAPGFSAALAAQVEAQVRDEFGGQRLYIPKGRKRLTDQQRQAVFEDGKSSMENIEITKKHKISKVTLYKIMKEGGGRFG